MTPFSVAGVQMNVSGTDSNFPAMGQQLDLLMQRSPWVRMVVFSLLCAFGPDPAFARPLPGPAEDTFSDMALKYGIWLLPGSMFENEEFQGPECGLQRVPG